MREVLIQIRSAAPADSRVAASLIHLSMGEEADWLFGLEKKYPTDTVLASLFQRKGNRLGYDLCWVAEVDGRAVGLILAYPGKRLRRLDFHTGQGLIRIFGLAATLRLVRRLSVYGNLMEAKADEMYISNLAVSPEMQGRGIGTALLSHADALARSHRLPKCSLLVTFDNPARRLYERSGYRMIHSYEINHPVVAHGSGGFHCMVKIMPPSAENPIHA